MAIFFHFIKNKKALFLGLLFFAILGFSLPFTALAANITRITPSPIVKDSPSSQQFDMTIMGDGFAAGSQVQIAKTEALNWIPIATTVDSPNQLSFRLTIEDESISYGVKVVTNGVSSNTVRLPISIPSNGTWETLRRTANFVTTLIFYPMNFMMLVWIAFQKLFGFLLYYVAKFCFSLFSLILYALINDPRFSITRDTGLGSSFLTAWGQMKAYANMLIVLELVAAAVMMILNIWKDNAKNIIKWVIIVALIVNFSVLLCGLLIDVSNILTKSLIGESGNLNIIEKLDTAHNRFLGAYTVNNGGIFKIMNESGVLDPINVAKFLFAELIFNIMYIVAAFLYLYLCVIFIQRYVYLAILFIFSPIAFALWPFPQTSHFFNTWWSHFLKNCFIGLGAAFTIYLAGVVLQAPSFVANQAGINGGAFTFLSINDILALANAFVPILLGLGFLLYGLRLTTKTAGPLGDMVMGAVAAMTVMITEAIVTGGASMAATSGGMMAKLGAGATAAASKGGETALGWAGKGAGSLSKSLTGNDALVKNATEQMRIGAFGKPGEAEANAKKLNDEKLGEANKRYGAITDVKQLVAMHGNTNDKTEQASITKRLGQLRALDAFDPVTRDRAIKNAITKGVPASELAKTYAEAAKYDESTIKELRRRNPSMTRAEAEEAAVRSAYPVMAKPESLELNDSDRIAKIVELGGGIDPSTGRLRNNVDSEGAKIIDDMAKEGTLGKLAKSLEALGTAAGFAVNGLEETTKQMNHTTNTFGSKAFKDAKKNDPRFIKYDEVAVKERAQKIAGVGNAITPAHTNRAKQELTDEGYGKISAHQIADQVDESVIDIEFIKNKKITADKIEKAGDNDRMSDNKKDALRKLASIGGGLAREIADAHRRGDFALRDELLEKYRVIKNIK